MLEKLYELLNGIEYTRDVPKDTVVIGVPASIRYSREEYDKKQRKWKES